MPVIDSNWPDELILDIRSAENRHAIASELARTIEICAEKGFDAIEIDNLDSYTRSAGAFSADDAIAFAALLAERAHDLGLAVGQKNAAGLDARDRVGFDFAVAEECHRFDECEAYAEAYGTDVLDIEYSDDQRGTFADACDDPAAPRSMILRDRDLRIPSEAGYVFEAC